MHYCFTCHQFLLDECRQFHPSHEVYSRDQLMWCDNCNDFLVRGRDDENHDETHTLLYPYDVYLLYGRLLSEYALYQGYQHYPAHFLGESYWCVHCLMYTTEQEIRHAHFEHTLIHPYQREYLLQEANLPFNALFPNFLQFRHRPLPPMPAVPQLPPMLQLPPIPQASLPRRDNDSPPPLTPILKVPVPQPLATSHLEYITPAETQVLTLQQTAVAEYVKRTCVCPDCNKRFTSRSKLIRHGSVHSRERPFSCERCHARFTQKSSLKTHMKKHQLPPP